jgi:integrase
MGNYVESIPDDKFKPYMNALAKRGQKYVILVLYGLETGLRVSDILKLRTSRLRANMNITEGKTGKTRKIKLSDELVSKIKAYKAWYGLTRHDYFIHSSYHTKNKPLSRIQAYRVMRDCAREVGITAPIGTHSMRKGFARRMYRETGSIEAVQRLLGHKYIETTIMYLVDIKKILTP